MSEDALSFAVQFFGYLALAKLALSGLGLLYSILGSNLPISGVRSPKSPGEVAVVTGATDGIGLAVAKELYRNGYNLILVSRTMDKLQKARAEVAMSCTSRQGDDLIRVIQFDFSSDISVDAYNELASKLFEKASSISVLYNNVGVSYDHAEFLEGLPSSKVDAIIEVNMRAMVKMSQLVLPGMLGQNRGAIVNIGSAAGSCADPLYSVYSGSKAFVEKFSASLAAEVGGKSSVVIQDHIPFFVATKLAKIRKSSFFAPSPETWAKASVSSIGIGGPVVVPYFPHKLQALALSCIPSFAWNRYKYGFGVSIRKRALKKLESKAKST